MKTLVEGALQVARKIALWVIFSTFLSSYFYIVPLVAPNISLINISSTSLEMNWTGLPSEFHNGILLGYKISVWEKDRLSGIRTELNARTFTPDEFYQQMTNLTKWTVYCVKITGCTAVGSGPSSPTECTRTNEDGKRCSM